MNHWMCDDKPPVLPLRDLRQMCDGGPPEPKGDHSLVSQKRSNYFLRIDLNKSSLLLSYSRPFLFNGTVVLYQNMPITDLVDKHQLLYSRERQQR